MLIFILGLPLISVKSQTIWVKDYQNALKISKETGKPLLLDFTASWCPPCRLMEQTFWDRAEVAEFSKQFVFVKIDADQNAELKMKYGVSGLPTVILADAWGESVDSHRGFGQNGDRVILEKLANFPKDFSSMKQSGERREKNANDLDALYQFADFYHRQKLYQFSIGFYKKILKLENIPEKRENTLLNLAYEHLHLGQSTLALENFEILTKEFPKSPQIEISLYGIIMAQINKQNLSEAESNFSRLKNEFPKSKFIAEAERLISNFKKRR
ncbi:MAG TPA: thioredoxin family protein [Pyrinomonadaceae bacterium]|nr:thioredoxin family protein [Pyrinomonadaceae bacterium]